mgnify:FL=1
MSTAGHDDQPAKWWAEMVARAQGRYIGFLDDDNLKHPDHVATMSRVLDDDPTVDLVTCGWVVVDDATATECHLNLQTDEDALRRNTVDTSAFLIRRETLEKLGYHPLDVKTNEDWALVRRAIMADIKMVHLPDALATYRVHDDQRLRRRDDLGNDRDLRRIDHEMWGPSFGVQIFHPTADRLTASQRDVMIGLADALDHIPWVERGNDLHVVAVPCHMSLDEVGEIASRARSLLSLHIEDPYARNTNLD